MRKKIKIFTYAALFLLFSVSACQKGDSPIRFKKVVTDKTTLFRIEHDHMWGAMDQAGNIVVEPNQEDPKQDIFFSNNLAAISILQLNLINLNKHGILFEKWGFIDRRGRWIIEPQYNFILNFSEGVAAATIDKGAGFIDSSNRWLIPPRFERVKSFHEGLAGIRSGEKWGFINKKGNLVISQVYDDIGDFEAGLALVSFNHKKGFIDKTGKWVIPAKFEEAYQFDEGLALVTVAVDKKSDKMGFIDRAGRWMIQPNFIKPKPFYPEYFSEGLAMAIKENSNGKVGFIDKNGRWAIPPIFDEANSFSEGLAPVRINGKWVYINKVGKIVLIPTLYVDQAESFYNGLAEVYLEGKKGYINKKGVFVWNFQ